MGEDIPSLKKVAEPRSLKPAGITVGYRRVRTRTMWALFAIYLVVFITGVVLLASPPMSESTSHAVDVLQPQEYTYWKSVHLDKGEQIIVNGIVKGGNNDIWVYIKEHGQKVRDFGKVRSPVHLVFTAPEDGNYSLYISNGMSLITSKSIDMNVIFKTYDYGPGAWLTAMGILLIVLGGISLIIGQKRLVMEIGSEVYEFWPAGKWKFNVSVSGVTLNSKVKVGEKFRIGLNDEHVLEIKKLSWKKAGFFVDGQEVGRLP